MTVKEWLNKGRKLNEEVNELMEAREKALNLACGGAVDTSHEKVQTSSGNTTERKFIAYADYAKLIDDKIDELVDYRRQMIDCISKVDNSLYRTILIAYYINCKTWEQIASELNYSIKQTHRIHGYALQKTNHVPKCP